MDTHDECLMNTPADCGDGAVGAGAGAGAGVGEGGGWPTPTFLRACCASGSLNGPFCPHDSSAPAKLTKTSNRTIRMLSSITRAARLTRAAPLTLAAFGRAEFERISSLG